MLEVLCTQGSFMRIGGKQLYTALVKERFLKRDSSHIEYVLDCLRESTADIRNIKAYQDLYKQRKETIKRVFADAKEKHTMRYTQYRGLAQVTNWVKLKFAAMNLKKLARWKWKERFL